MYKNSRLLAVIDDDFFQDNAFYYAKNIEKYADIVWYRLKKKDSLYNDKVIKMRSVVKNCPLILSIDYKSAIDYGYDGVHINNTCLHYLDKIYENKKLIVGCSCHSVKEIDNISADYYTLSPIYDTPKDYKVIPLGLVDYNKDKKVYALGGINLDNLENTAGYFYGAAGIRLIKDIVDNLVSNP